MTADAISFHRLLVGAGGPIDELMYLIARRPLLTLWSVLPHELGQPANSQRTLDPRKAGSMYEAHCRQCFVPHADAATVHEE